MAKTKRSGARGHRPREPASTAPVARVTVDVPLPHLDRPFDYLIPADLDEAAVPGCRVRVRFAGQLVDGFLLERVDTSEYPGRLAYVQRVVSPEPVLTQEIATLAREVADRYAGTVADVLRLAIPPRHAGVEAAGDGRSPDASPCAAGTGPVRTEPPEAGPWADYPAGPAFLAALGRGTAPRAVWTALPGSGWAEAVAHAVAATVASGRGALAVVPDKRDVSQVEEALTSVLGADRYVALTADLGPAERYRRWLAVRRGVVPAVVGTRAAAFAPVHRLGVVVLWDDGNDVHAEPHAPYPHMREVLALRAHRAGAGCLIGGFAHSAEAALLLSTGWARPLAPARGGVRARAPVVRPAGGDDELARDPAARGARLPTLAWRTAREALRRGPVLVQVPRTGYVPALSCESCRRTARCPGCAGPLSLPSADAPLSCGWCGRRAAGWRCAGCGSTRVRSVMVGARRTAEELGRAFPSVPVRRSAGDTVLDRVGAEPALVVATPGGEPVAEGGYAAALLLDGWALLGRPDLRAAEEALRRWLNAAALVRPARDGGTVVVAADGRLPVVQALVRWDPAGYARRELADRAELAFPPVARVAALTGTHEAVRDLLALADLPAGAEVLGPVPHHDDQERALVRVPRERARALAHALRAAQGVRSARKASGAVRVQVDPPI